MRLRRVWNWVFTFPDAQGRPCSVLRPIRVHRQHSGTRIPLWVSVAPFAAFLILYLGGCVALMVVALIHGDADSIRQSAEAVAIALATTVFCGAVGLGTLLLNARSACLSQLRSHICPRCGYRLRGLAPAAGGGTPCPECASSWRLTHPARRYGVTVPMPAREGRSASLSEWLARRLAMPTFQDARGTRWPYWVARRTLLTKSGRAVRGLALFLAILVAAPLVLYFATDLADWVASFAPVLQTLWWVGLLGAVGSIVLGAFWMERRRVPALRRACLAHRVCAVCGASLAGAASQDDGVTECPDCGAAWASADFAHQA